MSLGKKVASGVSWLAAAQLAQRATSLVVTAILARRLYPADFGLIALTLLTVNFVSYFQDMGFSSALVQRDDLEDDHLATAFWINLVAGIALAGSGLALAPAAAFVFKENRLTPLIAVSMLALPINGLGWASNSLLQRRLQFGRIAIIEWASTFISGIVAVTLALAGAGVWCLVAQNFAAAIVSTIGRLVCARWLPRLVFSLQRARELFSFSLSAFGYFLVNHGMRNVDNAIIGALLGATALGYYSLAYNLILLPGMTICSLVGRVMFPALSSVQKDLPRFRRAYLRMARTVAFLSLPLILGLGATAPLFVKSIYGDRWVPSIPLIHILIVVGIFEAMSVWGPAAWALGKTKATLGLALISLLTMSIAFTIGVRWGVAGVAWAYVVISPIVFLLPHFWTNRLMGLQFASLLKAITAPIVSSSLMALVVYFLISQGIQLFASNWASLLSYILFGAAVYGCAILATAFARGRLSDIPSWITGQPILDGGID